MNKLIVLRKYSLKKPSTGFIEPGPFEGIIKFEVDGQVTLKQGAYFTTNMFNTAGEAQKHLAITYSPKYECKFELNKDDINGVELRNPYILNEPTRVWPAFGKCGGGCEIILTRGKLKCNEPKEKFPHGGKKDPFAQDSTKSDKIFVNALAQILYNWLMGRKTEFYPKENIVWKILGGLGVVLSWIGLPSSKLYTISCAYKKMHSSTDLRFWGYIWDDKNDDRFLSKPVIRDHCFPYRIEEIKRRITQYKDPLSTIENTLTEIHNCLIPVAQNFDRAAKDTIKLPSYESL